MRRILFAVCVVGLAACRESKTEVQAADALPTVLVPPKSSMISREGGADALKLRFHTELEPLQAATYYRDVLSKPPWNLVSDTPDREGVIALYAERPNGPPLWVSISKASDGAGSFVDLAGASAKQ